MCRSEKFAIEGKRVPGAIVDDYSWTRSSGVHEKERRGGEDWKRWICESVSEIREGEWGRGSWS